MKISDIFFIKMWPEMNYNVTILHHFEIFHNCLFRFFRSIYLDIYQETEAINHVFILYN